jgi:hypothetical protein
MHGMGPDTWHVPLPFQGFDSQVVTLISHDWKKLAFYGAFPSPKPFPAAGNHHGRGV